MRLKNTKQGSITLGYTCLPDKHLKFYVKDTWERYRKR